MKDYKGDFDKVFALGAGNPGAQKMLNVMATRHTARMIAVLQSKGIDVSSVMDLSTPMTEEQVAADMGA